MISFENFSKVIKEKHYYSYDIKEESKKSKSKIEVRAMANISDNTELLIEMNKSLGEILKCRGNGNIDILVNPSRNIFDIRGDYTISEGSYLEIKCH